MNLRDRCFAVVSGCLLLIGSAAFAQDWPQWRGPNRDGKAAGFSAPATWPQKLPQKWKVTVGLGDSTPALVGDKLYVFTRQGSDEVTQCLSAADGGEVWRDKYEAQAVSGPAASHPGPRSSPTVADGKVVTFGVGGILSCLDASNGKVLWRKDEYPKKVPQFFTSMSPLVADGMAIAQVGGKGEGAIMAFDLASGSQKWKTTGEGPAYASPMPMTVDGTKIVVAYTEKSLLGVALADGKLLFQEPAAPAGRVYNSATPIVDGSTLYDTGHGKGTRAVKVEKAGDKLALKELWTNPQLGTGFDTPVLKDGMLFGVTEKGNLFCIDAKTGKTAWTDPNALKNFAAIVDGGSVMAVLPSNADLIIFKPTDKAFEQLAKIKVADTDTYATPVLAGTRVFVKDKESLTLFTVE